MELSKGGWTVLYMETLEKGEKRFQKTGNVCVWCELSLQQQSSC